MPVARGSTPAQLERARRELALRELAVMGGTIEVEPTEALLECVHRAAGQAAWLRSKVESLDHDEIIGIGAHGVPSPHIWVRLEQEAIDYREVRQVAIDAGVAERQARISERAGRLIAAALDQALAPLDLPTPRRPEVVGQFVQRLKLLEQTPDDAVVDG